MHAVPVHGCGRIELIGDLYTDPVAGAGTDSRTQVEGTLKFLRPETLGTGRFDKAGIPAPTFLANLDGTLEIICGILLLAGLATRVAAAPMIINMAGALLITKAPILWGNAALFPKASGWWDFIHESRTDLAQLCGATFLLLAGAGAYSLDAAINRRAAATNP